MQTAKDIEEYLTELLGSGGQNFQKEFFSHWHPPQRVPSPLTPQEGELLEELVRPQHEDMVLFRGEGGGGRNSGSNKGGKPKKVYTMQVVGVSHVTSSECHVTLIAFHIVYRNHHLTLLPLLGSWPKPHPLLRPPSEVHGALV